MRQFTTITTRFVGTCARCHQDIPAGTRVRYNGRCWHFAAECPASQVIETVKQARSGFEVVDIPYSADEQAVGGYPTPATEDGSRSMGATPVPSNRARNIPFTPIDDTF